jgi:hypothetical protein
MDRESDHSDDIDIDRQADDRLIHALLRHVYDDQVADKREQRVQRAMEAIREPVEQQPSVAVGRLPGRQRYIAWSRRSAWAAAAMVLVAVGLWVLTYSAAPAMASVTEIVSSLGRPGDRTYRIRMEDLPAPSGQRPAEENWPEHIPRPCLDDATLYLRDGRQYLLVRQDPNGELIYDGFDGRRSWRVKDGLVAETRDGLGAGGIPMPPIMADVPFCDLHRTLERILVDYTVEHLGQASLKVDGDLLRYVRVRRNSRDVKGPETIEIWADPGSAIPRRIVFDDAKIHGNRQPCRLTFELVSEEPLLPSWFTPAPHLSPGK